MCSGECVFLHSSSSSLFPFALFPLILLDAPLCGFYASFWGSWFDVVMLPCAAFVSPLRGFCCIVVYFVLIFPLFLGLWRRFTCYLIALCICQLEQAEGKEGK
jgi:hypothetical protein